jgi:hypothetical protein
MMVIDTLGKNYIRYIRKIEHNVKVLCAVWDLMHNTFNLALKLIKGTNAAITTLAHIAQNTCYGLPFHDKTLWAEYN